MIYQLHLKQYQIQRRYYLLSIPTMLAPPEMYTVIEASSIASALASPAPAGDQYRIVATICWLICGYCGSDARKFGISGTNFTATNKLGQFGMIAAARTPGWRWQSAVRWGWSLSPLSWMISNFRQEFLHLYPPLTIWYITIFIDVLSSQKLTISTLTLHSGMSISQTD